MTSTKAVAAAAPTVAPAAEGVPSDLLAEFDATAARVNVDKVHQEFVVFK